MKNILLLLFCFLTVTTSIAQAGSGTKINDSAIVRNETLTNYRLFPTENVWTFIKLDTRNGKMWQVQFDVEGDNRFETYLNLISLVDDEKDFSDRFTLYPTQNVYTFLLLDKIDGRTWQVQWSIEPETRGLVPIE